MSVIIYYCEWQKAFVAYDTDYEDEWTPHGAGRTEREALEDLRDTMSDFFNSSTLYNAWVREIEIGDRHE